MDGTMMVVAIVAVVMVAGVANHWIKANARPVNKDYEQDMDALKREVYDLRQRVHTLEKLATDPEENLKKQFERL